MEIIVEKKERLPNFRTPVIYHFPESHERLTDLARMIGPAAREMADCFLYEGPNGVFEFSLHFSHGEYYDSISAEHLNLPSSHPRQNKSKNEWQQFLRSKDASEYEVQRYPWNAAPRDPTFIAHFLEMIRQIAIQGHAHGSIEDYVVAVIRRYSEYGHPKGPATYLLDPYGFYATKY